MKDFSEDEEPTLVLETFKLRLEEDGRLGDKQEESRLPSESCKLLSIPSTRLEAARMVFLTTTRFLRFCRDDVDRLADDLDEEVDSDMVRFGLEGRFLLP